MNGIMGVEVAWNGQKAAFAGTGIGTVQTYSLHGFELCDGSWDGSEDGPSLFTLAGGNK
jgi:hypothetical protein